MEKEQKEAVDVRVYRGNERKAVKRKKRTINRQIATKETATSRKIKKEGDRLKSN